MSSDAENRDFYSGPMKTNANELDSVVWEIQQYLAFLKIVGCRGVDLGQKSIDIIGSWEKTDPKDSTRSVPVSLRAVFDAFLQCRRCGLADTKMASVFGAGAENAQLMFIGFAPEKGDEITGQPYTGKAGALLTRIIEAMGLDRNSVYISHAVKCFPQEGRLPGKWEARACRYYLVRQVHAIKPSVICVLGETAASALLRSHMPFERIRGKFQDFEGIPVMPTYDPAHLLVQPSAKRPVWEDMQKIMKKLDSGGSTPRFGTS